MPASVTSTVRVAQGALVRTTLLGIPPDGPASAAFREALQELAATEQELAARVSALGDALYASRAGHSAAFHREVVLPLRRALHNGRAPRPAVLQQLDDLPDRVPGLPAWLALRTRRGELLDLLAAGAPAALADRRAALALICREPAFARAAAFTSTDLLRAVERAARAPGDRKARKKEAGVLRYAVRAAARTTPLSWFAAVGWGALTTTARPAAATASASASVPAPASEAWVLGERRLASATAVVRANRTLVETLVEALLADPRRRACLPHRLCSSLRVDGGRASFARSRTALTAARFLSLEDDEVGLAAGGPLLRVAALCAHPTTLDELADRLGGPEQRDAVLVFLGRLYDLGLLVPVPPYDPQDPDPLPRLARWLRQDTGLPQDKRIADGIEEVEARMRRFGAAEPSGRTALLADLRERWGALLADAGRAVDPATVSQFAVVSEDLVLSRPVPLDGFLGADDRTAITELTELAELFDLGPVVRRLVRDRFVARYGSGGVCAHVWEFGADAFDAWRQASETVAHPGGGALDARRAAIVRAVHESYADGGGGSGAMDKDAVLSPGLLAASGHRMQRRAPARPVSYAWFLQRGTDGLLCVNHVYGGWGRFPGRFLDHLPAEAARETAAAVRHALGPSAGAAQLRPLSGFNANLHPLLLPDEIGDRPYASLGAEDVELVHDAGADEVRVRRKDTGQYVDVLYTGVFSPLLLPPRLAPLLTDHPHGITDFSALLPRLVRPVPGGDLRFTPRLRYGHVVLRRRRWTLTGGTVAALRAELADEGDVPAATAARWRALLGVPERLFLHAVRRPPGGGLTEDFLQALDRPKPQFVDLGDALHLRSLGKWLSRHPHGAVLEEALPAPGAEGAAPAVELVVETYRGATSGEAL